MPLTQEVQDRLTFFQSATLDTTAFTDFQTLVVSLAAAQHEDDAVADALLRSLLAEIPIAENEGNAPWLLKLAYSARPAYEFPGYEVGWEGYFISEVDGGYWYSDSPLSNSWLAIDLAGAWYGEQDLEGGQDVAASNFTAPLSDSSPYIKAPENASEGQSEYLEVEQVSPLTESGMGRLRSIEEEDESGSDGEFSEAELTPEELAKEARRQARRAQFEAKRVAEREEWDRIDGLRSVNPRVKGRHDRARAKFEEQVHNLGQTGEWKYESRKESDFHSGSDSDSEEKEPGRIRATGPAPNRDAAAKMQKKYHDFDQANVIYFSILGELEVTWNDKDNRLHHAGMGAISDGEYGWVLDKQERLFVFTDEQGKVDIDLETHDPNVVWLREKMKKNGGGLRWQEFSKTNFPGDGFRIRHSSFAEDTGGDEIEVLCAGMCKIGTKEVQDPRTGQSVIVQKILEADPCSGHFRPVADNLVNAINILIGKNLFDGMAVQGGEARSGDYLGPKYKLQGKDISAAFESVASHDMDGDVATHAIPHPPQIAAKEHLLRGLPAEVKERYARRAKDEALMDSLNKRKSVNGNPDLLPRAEVGSTEGAKSSKRRRVIAKSTFLPRAKKKEPGSQGPDAEEE